MSYVPGALSCLCIPERMRIIVEGIEAYCWYRLCTHMQHTHDVAPESLPRLRAMQAGVRRPLTTQRISNFCRSSIKKMASYQAGTKVKTAAVTMQAMMGLASVQHEAQWPGLGLAAQLVTL